MAPTPTASELRRAFDAAGPFTLGIEEEDVFVFRGRRPDVSAPSAEPAAARSGTGT